MKKQVLFASLIIGLAILAFVFAGQQKAQLTEQQIKSEIEKANYCITSEDCAPISYACPFDCNVFVNQKESARISTMLYSFVPTEQNSKMCSMIGACIEPMRVDCKNNRCEAIYKTKTGIRGTVTLTSGNCMPGEPSRINPCTQTKISRTIYIREPATMANMFGGHLRTKTNLVKQIASDANGHYDANLPAGMYSIFVEDNGGEYCNFFGGQDEACQVTITDGRMAEFNIDINYMAAY